LNGLDQQNICKMEVKAWQEDIFIPTYKIGVPDKNPMFLEKRVYQGSSGVVYPHPVIDKVYDEKYQKKYKALFIENQYLKVMVLPELGGRIQMALDKTNDYHFVYYNRVIKPALVGLAGPWISGGIEFNWPQHHRPSTFDPIDFSIEENADGSKTIWVSEIEKMFRTKGMAGFTLYPDKAYIEITGKLYNRTPVAQTFLWWANPAVSVDENYQSVFPPDVHAVFDHGKRDVSSFPIATGIYYKVDYAPGTDISRYKNIPVPTSYMAVNSEYDFVGGYHHGKKAGILHIANHHISPGKKQWTWGCGEFGKAWDRMLTDEDGPYFELMTGVFTDNQPDFGYIMPNEERTFKQYFMPYKNIGYVKNATSEAMVSLEIEQGIAIIKVYTTSERKNLTIKLEKEGRLLFEEKADISPLLTYTGKAKLKEGETGDWLKVSVLDDKEEVLVTYTAKPKEDKPLPEPAMAILQPAEIKTNEELYFSGLHIEQYRHATFNAADYYLEALKRDPSDARCNNAMGLLLYRKGQFAKAEPYFRKAIETITFRNLNPYNSEPLYNLGLCLRMQNKHQEAFKWFYKSAWDTAWQDNAYFQLAQIACMSKNWSEALELIEKSLVRNTHNYKARHLKTAILRKLGKLDESITFARETIKLDLFDFGTRYELIQLIEQLNNNQKAQNELADLKIKMRHDTDTYIEISLDYSQAGMYHEAFELLSLIEKGQENPMPLYYMGFFLLNTGKTVEAKQLYLTAAEKNPNYIFPNRLEDIHILQHAIDTNPSDYKALYYLGNLWYDKRQYDEAINCWERSAELFDGFATVHRNLGLAYFNKRKDARKALQSFERAFACDQSDSRVLYELDQLYKRLGKAHADRLTLLEEHLTLTNDRDDLYLERVILYNQLGNPERAKVLIESRNFHPWEGGEGKVSGQYLLCHTELAKKAIKANAFAEAIDHLKTTEIYPENLGEGKLYGAQENDIDYFMGIAYEKSGNYALAEKYFKKASEGLDEPAPAIFYNDQPPEKIFYQGLANLKLRDAISAERKFNKLIEYGEKHIVDTVKIDYFAVSLPDMQIFDDDLTQRNINHCNFMIGLGYLGLTQKEKSDFYFKKVLENDNNHLGAIIHLKLDI